MRWLERLVKYDERVKIDKRLHQAAPGRLGKWLGHWTVLQLYQNRHSNIINKRCVVVGSRKLDPVGQLCFAPKHQMLWSSPVRSSHILVIDWKGSVCPGISSSIIYSCLLTWLIMYHSTQGQTSYSGARCCWLADQHLYTLKKIPSKLFENVGILYYSYVVKFQFST